MDWDDASVQWDDKPRSSDDNPLDSHRTQLFSRSLGTIIGSQTTSYDTTSMMTPRCSHQHDDSKPTDIFSETECGEPMVPQQILVDFTPTAEDEVEEVRQKCIDFWDFFNSIPELQKIIVEAEPDSSEDLEEPSVPVDTLAPSPPPHQDLRKTEKSAMSFLEDFTEKDIFAGLLSCKMPGSGCSLGSPEYHEHDPMTRGIGALKMRQPCRCIGICNQTCSKIKKMTSPEVQLMSKNLNNWTKNNPKSMEPPGHAPELKHAVMQRKLVPVVGYKDSSRKKLPHVPLS